MARYTGPVCKLCRREKIKLFLKGAKCISPSCPVDRRPYPPGEHGRIRPRTTEYMLQLREKQKARRIYGVLEKQFQKYYREATRKKGVTGENLLKMLELRLDNAVFRAGFAESRPQARQLVRHGHVTVNGNKVDIPSYELKPGDTVAIREKSRNLIVVRHSIDTLGNRAIPGWLDVDHGALRATVTREPERSEIDIPVNEQLIVELYSK
ncbi:MAG: 30S ribosomal protein S4 [Acidimicrobiia bacterium]